MERRRSDAVGQIVAQHGHVVLTALSKGFKNCRIGMSAIKGTTRSGAGKDRRPRDQPQQALHVLLVVEIVRSSAAASSSDAVTPSSESVSISNVSI
jgi:hypothetical protein